MKIGKDNIFFLFFLNLEIFNNLIKFNIIQLNYELGNLEQLNQFTNFVRKI